ncbi:MAG: threonine aldolase [Phycisphaerales bacterium]|jgi:threonine aldolase
MPDPMPEPAPAQSSSPIDLRSDTVTKPTPAMLEAMVAAELGDDVLGDEPTVQRLEAEFAALIGKPAACFVPSGTMANQTAIRALTEPGDEIIADRTCHIFHYETGAPAALSGCGIRFADGPAGVFEASDVRALVRAQTDYLPRTRLVLIENTSNGGGGRVWPIKTIREVCDASKELGLRVHLDGARLWNASVASGVSMADYAAGADTVSCCFSKGLGAPVGSIVGGSAELIARVRRFRKMFGGAMRQSGLLAAAALYAMENNVDRLAEDHTKARVLAEGVNGVGPMSVDMDSVQTNIVNVMIDPSFCTGPEFATRLEAQGVRLFALSDTAVRVVTHLDVSMEQVERAVGVFKRVTESA